MAFILTDQQARDTLFKMITQFGFGSSLGLYAPPANRGSSSLSGHSVLVLSEVNSLRVEEEIKVSH
jgi:hypothetical protein